MNGPSIHFLGCSRVLQRHINDQKGGNQSCNALGDLGIKLHKNFNFYFHINSSGAKLNARCSDVRELRQCLHKGLLLLYHNLHINPVFKYGVLVHGRTGFGFSLPIFKQQKNLRLNLQRSHFDFVYDDFFPTQNFFRA